MTDHGRHPASAPEEFEGDYGGDREQTADDSMNNLRAAKDKYKAEVKGLYGALAEISLTSPDDTNEYHLDGTIKRKSAVSIAKDALAVAPASESRVRMTLREMATEIRDVIANYPCGISPRRVLMDIADKAEVVLNEDKR